MKREKNKFNKRFWNYYPTEDEWWELKKNHKMQIAVVCQTMGPHWKNIYWTPHPKKINKRPYVLID